MSRPPISEEEAKRLFVARTDALNLHAQTHGPASDSAQRMKAIIADHEAQCAALAEDERATSPGGASRTSQRPGL